MIWDKHSGKIFEIPTPNPKTYQVMTLVDFWQDQDFSISFQVEVDHPLGLREDFEDSNPIFYGFEFLFG